MLKKEITFSDLDGNPITETFYFNLSKSELAELELSETGGLAKLLSDVIKSGDTADIVQRFKWILAKAYGVRSEDNRRFIKTPEAWEEFSQTGAYDELFMEILTNATSAAEFITNIIPQDLADKMPNLDEDSQTLIVNVFDANRQADLELEVENSKSEEKPWAHRDPTNEELRNMTHAELLEAMSRKNDEIQRAKHNHED